MLKLLVVLMGTFTIFAFINSFINLDLSEFFIGMLLVLFYLLAYLRGQMDATETTLTELIELVLKMIDGD